MGLNRYKGRMAKSDGTGMLVADVNNIVFNDSTADVKHFNLHPLKLHVPSGKTSPLYNDKGVEFNGVNDIILAEDTQDADYSGGDYEKEFVITFRSVPPSGLKFLYVRGSRSVSAAVNYSYGLIINNGKIAHRIYTTGGTNDLVSDVVLSVGVEYRVIIGRKFTEAVYISVNGEYKETLTGKDIVINNVAKFVQFGGLDQLASSYIDYVLHSYSSVKQAIIDHTQHINNDIINTKNNDSLYQSRYREGVYFSAFNRRLISNTSLSITSIKNAVDLSSGAVANVSVTNNSGLDFNSVDSTIKITPAIGILSQYTHQCWVYLSNQTQATGDQTYLSIMRLGTVIKSGLYVERKISGNDELTVLLEGIQQGSSVVLAKETWHHIALSFDTGAWKLYINGKLNQQASGLISSYDFSSHEYVSGYDQTADLVQAKLDDMSFTPNYLYAQDFIQKLPYRNNNKI
jgi:hypothetical protein